VERPLLPVLGWPTGTEHTVYGTLLHAGSKSHPVRQACAEVGPSCVLDVSGVRVRRMEVVQLVTMYGVAAACRHGELCVGG
jgi:hypothetical protein